MAPGVSLFRLLCLLLASALLLALLLRVSSLPAGLIWTAVCVAFMTGLWRLSSGPGHHTSPGTGERSPGRACVLVLGDIGRSPRMQYHALSLSKHGYDVTFVGFLDSKPHPDVLREKRIQIRAISDVRGITVGPKLLKYVSKVVLQSLQLLWVLLNLQTPDFVLLQNPPGLPAIAVTWLVSAVRRCSFIMDWHNYGYSIMALNHGATHPLVRLALWYERVCGPLASHHLCVTKAMRQDLLDNWGIR
ncbi:unnamed protein product [Knipowitschia caucasica]